MWARFHRVVTKKLEGMMENVKEKEIHPSLYQQDIKINIHELKTKRIRDIDVMVMIIILQNTTNI